MEVSENTYNFKILSGKEISKKFLAENITDFESAVNFIRHLPYRRNADKDDLLTIFSDACGTCSTKHALLKQLAIENSVHFIKLKLGVFKMNGKNTPPVAETLKKHKLEYIPEAHNYLTIGGEILDCTRSNSKKEDFIQDLITEIEIEPNQITSFKVAYHKEIMRQWLNQPVLPFSLEEIWSIREECIGNLSK